MDIKFTPKPQRPQRVRNNRSITNLKSMMLDILPSLANLNINKSNKPKRRRQRRRRAMIRNEITNNMPYESSITPFIPPSMSLGTSTQLKQMNLGLRRVFGNRKLTPAGLSFLKCAFAPVDFASSDVRGVPDKFEGVSLVKKHRLTSNITNPSGRDTYVWLAPIPGVAYLYINKPAGDPIVSTDIWEPVAYADYTSLFPSIEDMANIVNKYRFVSNHFELVPTVNQMSWSGSITAWKFPVSQVVRSEMTSAALSNMQTYTGLNAANATNVNMYSGPVYNGVYSGCYSTASEFEFRTITERMGGAFFPDTQLPGDFTRINTGALPTRAIAGFDNGFDNAIFKISGNTTENTFLVRSFACVEYQTVPGSALYEYQTMSPCDEMAIAAYKAIIKELPIGVTYMDNDHFWKRVLSILSMLSGGLSILPGPYGAIARGVNMASSAGEMLLQ